MARIACLSLGTTVVSACVLSLTRGQPAVYLGSGWVPSAGIDGGEIVDLPAARRSVAAVLDAVERASSGHVGHAILGISVRGTTGECFRGRVTLGRAPQPISRRHASAVIKSALSCCPRPHDVVHVLPLRFWMDERSSVRNPIGLQGARLEADILTLTTPQGSLDALVRCVQDQGIDIQEVVFGPLAVAEATVSPGEREAGVLVIHIGTAVTTLLVFASGTLQILDQVEIGGRHITNDIAVVMQLSLRQAEHVKTTYGSAFLEHESQRMVPVPLDEGYAPAPVPEQLLSDVIRARVEEILDLSVDTLAQQISTVALPAGIVLTGGSAHLPGIDVLARHHLGLSARVGVPRGPRDRLAPGTSWSVAVSLAQWAEKGESDLARERELLPTTRLRRVARRFLPLGGD